jgi:ADP-heptose:LPS heptosyltransferase
MSNILIIKHGSLGDIVQISGILKDIRNHFSDSSISILTSKPYQSLFEQCPYVDHVLLDERKARWNFFYLYGLMSKIVKQQFSQVIDLQNSSRTEFYRKYLFNVKQWSSSYTILQPGETKEAFDQDGVLERFQVQLQRSSISTEHTLTPDFSWAVDKSFSNLPSKPYIFLSPFSSSKLPHKRWPHYQELIQIIKNKRPDINIVVAPGPGEIELCKELSTTVLLDGDRPTNFSQLASIIKHADVVIANDTGPAHMAAHLGCKGVVLFGAHTSPQKVSIETKNFKAITSENLEDLTASSVWDSVQPLLKS